MCTFIFEQQNTKILRYYKRDTLLTLYSFIQKSEEQNTDLSFATFWNQLTDEKVSRETVLSRASKLNQQSSPFLFAEILPVTYF